MTQRTIKILFKVSHGLGSLAMPTLLWLSLVAWLTTADYVRTSSDLSRGGVGARNHTQHHTPHSSGSVVISPQEKEEEEEWIDGEHGGPLAVGNVSYNHPTPRRRRLTPRTGTSIKVFMLLVQFSNHVDRVLPDPSYYKDLCDGPAPSTTNPVGSLKDFFNIQSNGEYQFTCEVSGWHMTDNTDAFYSKGCSNSNSCTSNKEAAQMAHAAMAKAEAEMIQKYGMMWWIPFDTDKDYNFDMFVIIHSGYSSISINAPICDGTPAEMRILSQARFGGEYNWQSSGVPPIRITDYAIASGFEDGDCDTPPAMLGIIAHEMTHLFGAPDLYDVTTISTKGHVGGVADFDVMASLRGPENTAGSIPGSLSAYTKEIIGWGDVQNITEDGEYELDDVATAGKIFRIDHGFQAGEYLLIENRQKTNFDKTMFGSGIVIYHVDSSAPENDGGSSAPGDGDWPSRHYRVAVVQKDGKFDLEKGVNSGDAGDYWTLLDTLTPSGGDISIQPNSDSYYTGSTGISIRIMSEPSSVMKFFVSGISDPPLEFPSSDTTRSPTSSPTTLPLPTSSPTTLSLPTSSPTNQPSTQVTAPTTSSPTTAPSGKATTLPTALSLTNPPPASNSSSRPTTMVTSTPTMTAASRAPTVSPTTLRPGTTLTPSVSAAPSSLASPTAAPEAGMPTTATVITPSPTETAGQSTSNSENNNGTRAGTSSGWLVAYIALAGAALVGASLSILQLYRRLQAMSPNDGGNPSGEQSPASNKLLDEQNDLDEENSNNHSKEEFNDDGDEVDDEDDVDDGMPHNDKGSAEAPPESAVTNDGIQDSNPFNDADSNPFNDAGSNPFNDADNNPFNDADTGSTTEKVRDYV